MNKRIIRDITEFIFISDEPVKSDVMFLPGGSDPKPPERAAELYKSGYADILLPSGGVSLKVGKPYGDKLKTERYNGNYNTDCDFYTDVLIKNGVSESVIIGEDKSGYTKQNAQFTREVTDRCSIAVKTALIVCKSFHARRSLMCYQLAYPEAEIRIVPVDVYGISRDNWYKTDIGVKRVTGELFRCGNQFTDELRALIDNW